MKALLRRVFVAVCLLFAMSAVFAEQKASVVYEQAADQRMAVIQKTLKTDAEFSDDRAELCIDEYDNAASDWFALLENHIRVD